MKKYILVFAFIWLSFVNVGYAQTSEKQDAYQQALIQLISLLQEQVKVLVQQLAIVTAQQSTLQTQITNMETKSTTTSQPQPSFASAYVAPAEIDKTEIKVETFFDSNKKGNGVSPTDTTMPDVFPFGRFLFTVTYLNKEGKPTKDIKEVTMEVPDNMYEANIETRPTNPVGQIVFGYVPKSVGKKTITFSSGSLNVSTNVEVK